MSKMEVKKVAALSLNGNMSENWRKFKQNFEIFATASELNEKSEEIKIAFLLNCIGEDGVELYNTFDMTEEQKKSYSETMKAFENFCSRNKKLVVERFNFFSRCQEENEPFDNFLVDLKKLAGSCEFGEQTESLLRDRIVIGTNNKRLQDQMLELDADFKRAVEMCRKAETREQTRNMQEVENTKNAITNNNKRMDNTTNKNNAKVKCYCDKEAIRFLTRKIGPNKGRYFYKCAKNSPKCKNFFQWEEEEETAAGSSQNSNNGSPIAPPMKRKCGLCRQEGHTKLKCPRES